MPDAKQHVVRAGPATALLQDGFVRRIRVGPHEVVRGVYAAVRDENWGTIEPTFSHYELEDSADRFRLRFTADHRRGDIDFTWQGRVRRRAERPHRVSLRRRLSHQLS